jgi:Interleukin-like EMT inducer
LYRRYVSALLLYLALTLALTYPLLLNFTDHVAGTATWAFDEYTFVWSQWWVKHALFDLGVNPFTTNSVFYPLGLNLASFTMLWPHALLGLPLQFAFGVIAATNATVLFTFVVGAFGMYLLARYLLRLTVETEEHEFIYDAAAFVAGLAFAFNSSRWVYTALGHYNVVATQWFPFYILFLIKTLRGAAWKNPLLAALFASLTLYSDSGHAPLLLLFTALLLVYEWRMLRNRPVWARLALVGAATALFFAPVLIPLSQVIFFSGYTLPGFGDADKLVVDLMGFFTPTSLHPLNRQWLAEIDQVRQGLARFSDINTFFVGYVTALLALFGAVRSFWRVRLWIGAALVFAVLSLGPLLHINGVSQFDLDGLTVTFPLPYLVLHYIPVLRENRTPNRYSILVTLSLAILIAYGVWWLLFYASRFASRFSRRPSLITGTLLPSAFCFLLSALLLFEHLAVPLPLTDARVPEVYAQIHKVPGDFTILSLPLGWRDSFGQLGAEDTRTQYYQSVHGKFLLSGNASRNPPFLFDYFSRAPILSSIIALETYKTVDAATLERDRAFAASFVYFFDLRYLVVNAAVPDRPPYSDTRDSVLQYVEKVLPLGEKTYDRDGTVAYQINQPPAPTQLQIDLGTPDAYLYEGEGWQPDENIGGATANWSTQQNARVFLPLRSLRDYVLTVHALPFDWAGHTQSLTLFANGQRVATLALKPGWSEYQFRVNHSLLHAGLNELTWQFGYLVRPSEAIPPDYAIGKTGVASPVDIAVESTSQFASIKIAGREVSPLQRGYNLAVIDPKTGAVLDVKNFDTGGKSIVESRSLTDFISKLPQGVIVAGAVQEDASAMLGERAAAAIQSLGLTTDLRGKPGQTHAFIAVKGQTGGLEATGGGTSLVSVGHNIDNRWLGVAFDWIRVTPDASQ